MKSKQIVAIFGITVLFILIVFVSYFYILDPLNVLREKGGSFKLINNDMRLSSAGVIDNANYDSIVLGTSIFENTSSKDADKNLGGKFVNLSISGSDFWERKQVLDYALQKAPVKKIVYSLDYSSLVNNRMVNPSYPLEQWAYLYDNSRLNNFKAYLQFKGIKSSAPTLICKFQGDNCSWLHDVDKPNPWEIYEKHMERFGGLDNWLKAKNNYQIREAFSEIVDNVKHIEQGDVLQDENFSEKVASSKVYIDETIINYAKKYPETEFILVIPTYSRIKDAINMQYDKPTFALVNENIRYLVNTSSELKNIKVYGWSDTDYPDDIKNYKDLTHFHPDFNALMLEYIKNSKGLLTNDNIDDYLTLVSEKSKNYDVVSIGNQIEEYLKANN